MAAAHRTPNTAERCRCCASRRLGMSHGSTAPGSLHSVEVDGWLSCTHTDEGAETPAGSTCTCKTSAEAGRCRQHWLGKVVDKVEPRRIGPMISSDEGGGSGVALLDRSWPKWSILLHFFFVVSCSRVSRSTCTIMRLTGSHFQYFSQLQTNVP